MPSLYDKMLAKSMQESQKPSPKSESMPSSLLTASTGKPQPTNEIKGTLPPSVPPVREINKQPFVAELRKSSNAEVLKSSNEELRKSGDPQLRKSSNAEMRKIQKRDSYSKGSYRMCDEAIYGIEDALITLRRRYNIKATREDLVEAIVLDACRELTENKHEPGWVKQLAQIVGSKI